MRQHKFVLGNSPLLLTGATFHKLLHYTKALAPNFFQVLSRNNLWVIALYKLRTLLSVLHQKVRRAQKLLPTLHMRPTCMPQSENIYSTRSGVRACIAIALPHRTHALAASIKAEEKAHCQKRAGAVCLCANSPKVAFCTRTCQNQILAAQQGGKFFVNTAATAHLSCWTTHIICAQWRGKLCWGHFNVFVQRGESKLPNNERKIRTACKDKNTNLDCF